MNPHSIHILDKADGDHLILGVADHLQLQFLPAQNRLLDQYLADEAGGNAPAGHSAQLLHIVDQAASRAAHGIGGADHHGIAQISCYSFGVLHAVDGGALGYLYPQIGHGLLEGDAILTPLYGIDLHPDHLHSEPVQDAGLCQLGAEVEAGLAAQIGQDGIRPLLFNDLSHSFQVEGLDVGDIGHGRIGHNSSRIGVDQNYPVAQPPQSLAGLGSGVVEFTGLADDNGAGANDHHLAEIVSLRHNRH
ncbi:MAG: hypothetical protein BWY13_01232 [Euryarchaeota archaeon ADurb.Bin190]|nr:MAG: hypothetical protein BWY13_01232 [Euryarchaeota archaeon ADurb.Bin190]